MSKETQNFKTSTMTHAKISTSTLATIAVALNDRRQMLEGMLFEAVRHQASTRYLRQQTNLLNKAIAALNIPTMLFCNQSN